MTRAADLPVLRFADAAAFAAWLEAEHDRHPDGIWVEFAKQGSGVPSVAYAEVLDVALCFGWIDAQVRGVDDAWYRQRWLPRRPRSIWSKRNVAKAEALIAAGRMRAAGHAEVERAKADGRWAAAYDGPRTAAVPEDLRQALDADPAAAAFFAGLDANNRYAILHRVGQAKRPETRARRIAAFVAMCAEGRTVHPRRGGPRGPGEPVDA
jgi:uncharacterized protein YdeI (YjbR/CyaY-like superfamily)